MRLLAQLGLVALAAPLAAQCCLGAQDSDVESHNGRFRIRARSLTGTGPSAHGPYKFTFSYEARDDSGQWQQLGSFERGWDTKDHFHMTVVPSSSGNGFVLTTGMTPDLLFLAPDGRELITMPPLGHATRFALWPHEPEQPYVRNAVDGVHHRWLLFAPLAQICGPEEIRRSFKKGEGEVFAPATTPEAVLPPDIEAYDSQRRMLTWTPALGDQQAPAVAKAIAALRGDDTAAWPAASKELTMLGMSSVAALDAALTQAKGEPQQRLQAVRDRIDVLTVGNRDCWRNLDLLTAALRHPDPAFVAAAASQLRRILPDKAEPTAQWVAAHRGKLQWNDAAQHYSLTFK